MTRHLEHPHGPQRLRLRRDRPGAALAVIILLVLAVSGMGLLTIRQGQQGITHSIVATDSQRALQIADACAAGAMKSLPMFLDVYLAMMRDSGGDAPPLFHQQFDGAFFGADPYGDAPRAADCVVQLVEIADDAPAPGYSEGGGCFKRITLRATASLSRVHAGGTASADIQQNVAQTVREVIVRGLFGPVSCY